MANPTFSIILPTYNRSGMLKEAIESVLSQTHSDFELIIINDGSQDDTERVATSFLSDKRIVYQYQKNKGKGPARNAGLSLSNGKYICFLDDDDIYLKNHLATYNEYIKKESGTTNILRTGVQAELPSGKKFISQPFEGSSISEQVCFVLERYFSLLDLCIPADLANTKSFPDIPLWQDKFYIIELLSRYHLIQLPEVTVVAREHPLRSVNTAHANPEIIQKQIAGIKEIQQNLDPEISVKPSIFEKTIQHIYATHITNSLQNGGFSKGIDLSRNLMGNDHFQTSIKTLLKAWLSFYFSKISKAFR